MWRVLKERGGQSNANVSIESDPVFGGAEHCPEKETTNEVMGGTGSSEEIGLDVGKEKFGFPNMIQFEKGSLE